MAEVEALRQKLEELEKRLGEEEKKTQEAREEAMEAKDEMKKVFEEAKKVPQVYVGHGRKLEVFKDRPTKPGDASVQDWIVDVRGRLALQSKTTEEAAAFIKDHLAGNARREILGRGSAVANDPTKILAVLEKVFGDGDTLPQLQQRFFAYKQSGNQNLLSCSLELVTLHDRIVKLDSNFKGCRESALKGRLAEAVQDESLRRELRRLNIEAPELSFFEFRDRGIEWMGTTPPKNATVNAIKTEPKANDPIMELLRKQTEQLELQQKQLNELQSKLQSSRSPVFPLRIISLGQFDKI